MNPEIIKKQNEIMKTYLTNMAVFAPARHPECNDGKPCETCETFIQYAKIALEEIKQLEDGE